MSHSTSLLTSLKKLDINLLIVFYAILQERSVSRAANALSVSQSNVSAQLRRLRVALEDELFTRERYGMSPTPRALEIAPIVASIVNASLQLVTTDREAVGSPPVGYTFTLAMSDDVESRIGPALLAAAKNHPVRPKFIFHQTNRSVWEATIEDSRHDAIIIAQPAGQINARYQKQILFSSSYLCIYNGEEFEIPSPLDYDTFVSMDHVRISFNGRRGLLDEIFDDKNLSRNVVASFSHFAGAVRSVVSARSVLTLPAFAAESWATACRLTTSPVPLEMPQFSVVLLWRVSQERNAYFTWLKDFISRAVG